MVKTVESICKDIDLAVLGNVIDSKWQFRNVGIVMRTMKINTFEFGDYNLHESDGRFEDETREGCFEIAKCFYDAYMEKRRGYAGRLIANFNGKGDLGFDETKRIEGVRDVLMKRGSALMLYFPEVDSNYGQGE